MFIFNKKRQEILTQSAATHRANIQRRLQHRLEIAKAKGDRALIDRLEAEADYFR